VHWKQLGELVAPEACAYPSEEVVDLTGDSDEEPPGDTGCMKGEADTEPVQRRPMTSHQEFILGFESEDD
jgi:hypothetical protein